MNKRRASVHKRCPRCRINETLCFCDHIHPLDTETRVSIIMHHREKHLTSNTANLARLVLKKCQIIMRGLPGKIFDIKELNIDPEETPLYLFPHDDAIELTPEFVQTLKKPVHLIVPDGTWSQAVKTYRREPSLHHIQCVKLPAGITGNYRLRKSSDRESGVCTYEAIMHALKALEIVDPLPQMQQTFDVMVERTIRGRTAFELKISDMPKKDGID